MKLKLENPYPLIHPNPCVIIGTKHNNNINFTTIGDCAVAGLNPALVFISLHKNHLACEYIENTNKFTINIPSESMVERVDYCGVFSGRKTDKKTLFKYKLENELPVIEEAMINLVCKVEHVHQIEKRVIIIARVIDTFVDESLYTNNVLNLENFNSIVYGLDNKYYGLGKPIDNGYEAYKKV